MQNFDMSAILGVKPLNQNQIDKINRQIIAKAKTLCELLADLHGVSLGDGLSINVLRNPQTNVLMSVHLTPVDLVDGEPVPRYVTALEVASH